MDKNIKKPAYIQRNQDANTNERNRREKKKKARILRRLLRSLRLLVKYQYDKDIQDNDHQKRKSKLEIATLAFVVVTAAATVAYTCITHKQLTTAEDQEIKQLRAYLGFNLGEKDAIRFGCDFASSDPKKHSLDECHIDDKVLVLMKNFGQTPASQIETCSFFLPSPTPDRFDVSGAFKDAIEARHCGGAWAPIKTMWPNESAPDGVPITKDAMSWLQRSTIGDGATFLLALISYQDAFGNPHKSYLCVRLISMVSAEDCGGRAPKDY